MGSRNDDECKSSLRRRLAGIMKDYVSRNGEAYAYYTAWRTTAEMLEDRNYEIQSKSYNITYTHFLSQFHLSCCRKPRQAELDALNIVATHKYKHATFGPLEKVVVSFREDCNLSEKMVLDLMKNNKVPSRIMLVFGGDVSTFERYPHPWKTGLCELELFHLSELILNVLRVQAEYKLITTEEMECLSKKGVEIARVHPKEFIARYFALDEGEIVKCTSYPEIFQANTGAENVEDEDEECGCGYNSYEDCKIVPKEISDVCCYIA